MNQWFAIPIRAPSVVAISSIKTLIGTWLMNIHVKVVAKRFMEGQVVTVVVVPPSANTVVRKMGIRVRVAIATIN